MICAYCGKNGRSTREHIISSGILDLFPECYLTFDEKRKTVYPSDPVINDVCDICNNTKLSYIDSYAKSFIGNYFVKNYNADDSIEIIYDYTLVQKMCSKYAYNDLRANNDNDASFFDSELRNWILDESTNNSVRNITILGGLAVNPSPVPDFIFGNKKIRWSKNPFLCSNSIIEYIDYETWKIIRRDDLVCERFDKYAFSYLFRFNTLQIIVIFWNPLIPEEELNNNQIKLSYQYPYSILDNSGKAVLKRCTSDVTFNLENLIDVSWGQGILDEICYIRQIENENNKLYIELVNNLWKEEENRIALDHPRNKP